MRRFDSSFLNNGLLPANLVNLTSNISALKTMAGMRKEGYTQFFTELEAVARVQSIKSSFNQIAVFGIKSRLSGTLGRYFSLTT